MTGKTTTTMGLLTTLLLAMASPLYGADETDLALEISATEESARMLADQQRLESLIIELEVLDGAYADELGEAYLSLGNNLLGQQQYAKAIAVFDKALQLVRIRNGLNDASQLKVLEDMIDASLDLEDWQTTDDYVHLYWHIAKYNFGKGRPERILALEQLAVWQEHAAKENLVTGMLGDLRDSSLLYEAEIEGLASMQEQPGTRDQLATLQLGYASLQYQLASLTILRPLDDYQDGTPRTVKQQQCQYILLPDGRVSRICTTVDVPNIDFYTGQSERRDREVMAHLGNMKQAVQEAYELLQQDERLSEDEVQMLTRVQEMTRQYNGFIEKYSF